MKMPTDKASGNVIYSYTRAQAIADGVLVDITEQAKATGFKLPTVVTDNLYHHYIEPPAGLAGEGQSVTGRLHDLLTLALFAAKRVSLTALMEPPMCTPNGATLGGDSGVRTHRKVRCFPPHRQRGF